LAYETPISGVIQREKLMFPPGFGILLAWQKWGNVYFSSMLPGMVETASLKIAESLSEKAPNAALV